MKSSLIAVALLMMVANVAKAQTAPPMAPPEIIAAANVKPVPAAAEVKPETDPKLAKAQEDFRRAARNAPVVAAPPATVAPRTTVVAAPKPVAVRPAAASPAARVSRGSQKAATIVANCNAKAKRPLGCVKRHIYSAEVRADEIGTEILKCTQHIKEIKFPGAHLADAFVVKHLTRLHASTDVAYAAAHRGVRTTTMNARSEYLASVLTFLRGEEKLRDTMCSPVAFAQAAALID